MDEDCECGGAIICKQPRSGYLAGEFLETNKKWQEEWFYIPDVELANPPQAGIITPFSHVPSVKRNSWSPRNTPEETPEVKKLHRQVRKLADLGLKLVNVMHLALS